MKIVGRTRAIRQIAMLKSGGELIERELEHTSGDPLVYPSRLVCGNERA